MKRWNTIQQFANELAEMEESGFKELNISQCSVVAKNVKNMYAKKGKEGVINHLSSTLPFSGAKGGFTMDQKMRVDDIMVKLFKYHWSPFSRIRNNMIRIGAVK